MASPGAGASRPTTPAPLISGRSSPLLKDFGPASAAPALSSASTTAVKPGSAMPATSTQAALATPARQLSQRSRAAGATVGASDAGNGNASHGNGATGVNSSATRAPYTHMASSPSLVGHGDLVSPRPGTTALYATPHLETVQPATGSTPSPSAFPDEAARRDHAVGGTGTVAGAGGSRPASPAPPHQLSQSDGASVPPGPAASASASGGIVAMGTIPADGRFNPPNQVVQSMVVPPLAPIQAKLTLDMAVRDSPQFRAHIARFQDDMDVIARWLEGLTKALREYAQEMIKLNEVRTMIVQKLILPQLDARLMMDGGPMRLLSDCMQTIYSLNAKLVDDVVEQAVAPLRHYIKNDLREVRELCKQHERNVERYDLAVTKFAQSKAKDASMQQEEAFSLFEIRSAYIHDCLDVAKRIIQTRAHVRTWCPDIILSTLYSHLEYHETSLEVFRGLRSSLDNYRERQRQQSVVSSGRLDTTGKLLEEDALAKVRPNNRGVSGDAAGALVPGSSSTAAATATTGANALTVPATKSGTATPLPSSNTLKTHHPIEKEGHLFKKSQGKGLGNSVWSRRYFIIKKGGFSYQVTNFHGRHRGMVLTTEPLNVLLCNVRVAPREERRFCFEVYTSKRRSFMLQAETEAEMQSWIATFEAAKIAIATSSDPKQTAAFTADSGLNPENFEGLDLAEGAEVDEDGETLFQSNMSPEHGGPDGSGRSDDGGHGGHSGDSGDGDNAIEGANVDENHGVVPTLKYPDSSFERRNEDLHMLLKSVPKSDFLIDSFTCALQKDFVVQGKIYLTQNRICFYTNLLGFMTVLIIHFKDVLSISRKSGPFYSNIIVTTADVQHSFKTFLRDDMRTFGSLKATWLNATTHDNPLSLQELFDSIYASYKRYQVDTMASDGSGSRYPTGGSGKSGKLSRRRQRRENGGSSGGHGGQASLAPHAAADSDDADDSHDDGARGDDAGGPGAQAGGKAADDAAPASIYPADFVPPTGEVGCECAEHLEKIAAEATLPIAAKACFEEMYGSGSVPFYTALHKRKGESNYQPPDPKFQQDWPTGQTRESTFIVPVSNPMVKVKETDVQCVETMVRRQEYVAYVVEDKIMTPALPYSDAFNPQSRVCITWAGPESCKIRISIGIKWHKNPLVKSIIRREAMKGLEESAAVLLTHIKESAARLMVATGAGAGAGAAPSMAAGGTAGAAAGAGGTGETGDARARLSPGAAGGPAPSTAHFAATPAFGASKADSGSGGLLTVLPLIVLSVALLLSASLNFLHWRRPSIVVAPLPLHAAILQGGNAFQRYPDPASYPHTQKGFTEFLRRHWPAGQVYQALKPEAATQYGLDALPERGGGHGHGAPTSSRAAAAACAVPAGAVNREASVYRALARSTHLLHDVRHNLATLSDEADAFELDLVWAMFANWAAQQTKSCTMNDAAVAAAAASTSAPPLDDDVTSETLSCWTLQAWADEFGHRMGAAAGDMGAADNDASAPPPPGKEDAACKGTACPIPSSLPSSMPSTPSTPSSKPSRLQKQKQKTS